MVPYLDCSLIVYQEENIREASRGDLSSINSVMALLQGIKGENARRKQCYSSLHSYLYGRQSLATQYCGLISKSLQCSGHLNLKCNTTIRWLSRSRTDRVVLALGSSSEILPCALTR